MPCDDDDDDDDEYTNLSFTSASCSFYSYTPHLPSSISLLLPSLSHYTLITTLSLYTADDSSVSDSTDQCDRDVDHQHHLHLPALRCPLVHTIGISVFDFRCGFDCL